ncbi:hypothetical protein GI582_11435 [Sulfitobacter sp. BDSS02]|nr:hypothetical protein [Sulfitobacter sp. BDSS02]MBR9850096.1 hypothetical protein [Paracoccaceae bacterium]
MLHLPNKRLNPHKGSMIFAKFAAFGRSAAGSRRIGHFQPVGPIYAGDGALPVKNGSHAPVRIFPMIPVAGKPGRRQPDQHGTSTRMPKETQGSGEKKRPHEAGVKLLRQVSYRQETYRAVPLL